MRTIFFRNNLYFVHVAPVYSSVKDSVVELSFISHYIVSKLLMKNIIQSILTDKASRGTSSVEQQALSTGAFDPWGTN